VESGDLDYRTRLLIRRGVEALRAKWDDQDFRAWFESLSRSQAFQCILHEQFEEVGFHHLNDAVVMATKPEHVRRFLEEVDGLLHEKLRIVVGGSISVILRGMLTRQTTDVDIVNEVPVEIRKHHAELNKLAQRFGLELGHFQSHYIPAGWEDRISYWSEFRYLSVYLIDPYDFYVGKLFSRRDKDLDDLRSLVDQLDKRRVTERLARMGGLLNIPDERSKAEQNWRVLYGEPLPAPPASDQEPKS
jgi:hypothetical protein